MGIISVNPYTGNTNTEFEEWTPAATDEVLDSVWQHYPTWSATPVEIRAQKLLAVAEALRKQAQRLSLLMALEMGKPVTQGRAEILKCALVCDHYAQHGPAMLAPQEIVSDASRSYVRRDPMGVVLAVMPWNFPFWQVFRIAAPVLMGGNAMVLKHASNVPQCALAIEEIFQECGLTPTFRTLMINARHVDRVIAHPGVVGVSLTGSGPAGAQVAATAGSHLKKCLLELGGSDPFVVLADADLDLAVSEGVLSRFLNAGQTCIAAKRFIIEASVHDTFLERFTHATSELIVGDPENEDTVVGPLAKAAYCHDLQRQVDASVRAGARLVLGGYALPGEGAMYAPTILTDVTPGMAAFDEETFGPVAAVVRAENAAHALQLANQTPFGLGASIWTKNGARADSLIHGVDAGCVFVNGMVRSDPRLPFGGIKASGFGRELSTQGMYEFLNTKTVWIR